MTVLSGNTYSECFIGVTLDSDNYRGGLLNFHSVLGISITNETFLDIGPFTSE